MSFNFMILVSFSVLVLIYSSQVFGLKCYSCSSNSGDRFCHEDSFDASKVKQIDCPPGADVCIRAIQKEEDNKAGAIFRACGSSERTKNKEILMLGYYPPYNKCVIQKIGPESPLFNSSIFEICATTTELGNGKGEFMFPKNDE